MKSPFVRRTLFLLCEVGSYAMAVGAIIQAMHEEHPFYPWPLDGGHGIGAAIWLMWAVRCEGFFFGLMGLSKKDDPLHE